MVWPIEIPFNDYWILSLGPTAHIHTLIMLTAYWRFENLCMRYFQVIHYLMLFPNERSVKMK